MEINTLKNKIDELENSLNNNAGEYMPDIEINIDNTLQQLEEIRNQNILIEDRDTDEAREQLNKELAIQNKIRIKMGLSNLPYHVLDKDLETLIALDSGSIGNACKEFFNQIEDKALKQEIEVRINSIVQTSIAEQDRETARLNFLADASYQLEQLSKYRPEQFCHVRNKNNELVIVDNLAYSIWKKDILELSARINNQIKAVNSISQEFEDEKAPDRRESLFKLQKKVADLIEMHQLNKAGDR
jgi:hypothetical protein